MKDLFLSAEFGEKLHIAFTRSWFGFIFITSGFLFLMLSLFMNLSFYLWKLKYLPYQEKTFVNLFFELITVRVDSIVLIITALYLAWSFFRLFLDPLFYFLMLPIEKLWGLFGKVSQTHGNGEYDPYDWYDIVEMRVFHWRERMFIFSTGEAMILLTITCWTGIYFALDEYFDWWAICFFFPATAFFWLGVNHFRYVFYDEIPDEEDERYNRRKSERLIKGISYSVLVFFLFILSFATSPRAQKTFLDEFSAKTKVEVCTNDGCSTANYLQKTSFGHIILYGGKAVAVPDENLKSITFK